MNTAKNDTTQYGDMLRRLDAADGSMDIRLVSNAQGYPNDLHSDGVRNFNIIDYIFLRPNGTPHLDAWRSMYNVQAPWSPQHRDLSDHFPVCAEIWW
jgi:endonuclease/exonuclease/phosphatase family metal-dependent hydrolase